MRTTVAVVEFGTSKIVTLVAADNPNNHSDLLGAGVASYDGFCLEDDTHPSSWNDPEHLNEAIARSVQEAEAQTHSRLREVHVGVPGGFCETFTVIANLDLQGADPHVTPDQIDKVFEIGEQMLPPCPGVIVHRSPAWFSVDNGQHTLEPVGMKGRVLSAMISFVYADRMFINDVTARMNSLGLTVRGFYSSASAQATLYIPEEERDHTAVLIDVGYLQTDIIVVEGDAVTCHSTIPVGGGHIAADLAFGLEIDLDVAEQLKRQYCFSPVPANQEYVVATADNRTFKHEEIRSIVEERAEEIAVMVNKELETRGVRLGSWSNLYLTGGGLAMNKGGRDFFSAKIGRTVRDLPKRSVKLHSPIYTSVLGLVDLVIDSCIKQSALIADSNPVTRFFRNLLN